MSFESNTDIFACEQQCTDIKLIIYSATTYMLANIFAKKPFGREFELVLMPVGIDQKE